MQDLLLIDFNALTTKSQDHLAGVTAAVQQIRSFTSGIIDLPVWGYYQRAKISYLAN